ncbi:MAG: helix-turn-helix domain-containing protein [Candidatus Aenigmarchaeota archaeon]|nr:helix-turn-helix domain-containing protein [Candidatus Aenigmarchaeota archaeon]
MKPFCEVIVSSVLPSIRSLIAKELIKNYNLTQEEAAKLLGLTQAAISQYYRESRGTKVKLLEKSKEVVGMIKKLEEKIVKEGIDSVEMQKEFCKICKEVRKEKIICKLHKGIYPSITSCKKCTIC